MDDRQRPTNKRRVDIPVRFLHNLRGCFYRGGLISSEDNVCIMGSHISKRRRNASAGQSEINRQGATETIASMSCARNLQEALLDSYAASLCPEDLVLQFGEDQGQRGRRALQRLYIQGVLIDRVLLENAFNFLDARSLMRTIEVSKTFFQIADTPWLWDALDGLGYIEHSMGRYDFRCRHHRMRLTQKEKQSHLSYISEMEKEEHLEKKYRESRLDRFSCAQNLVSTT